MKNLLRTITDRQKKSIPREADLRGLGQSPLLVDLPPLPFLCLQEVRSAAATEIAKVHGFASFQLGSRTILHGKRYEPHKKMAISLFVAALRVSREFPSSEMYLGEQDILGRCLHENADSLTFHSIDQLAFRDLEIPVFNGPLTICPRHQFTLQQAGLPLVPREQEQSFPRSDLDLFVHLLIAPHITREASGES